ncbi:hypothetical protein [Paraclostridium sordellii]|uniref:hypothetical protein n=1 Tax=Paraclostridium sordellii TaxID=1505 RepID=UPI001F05C1B1|nr:hypothetical protein [Paeniclostridium sordellii]MCH1966552.1 hypothetical protein [Paeniclostridium sordellii]
MKKINITFDIGNIDINDLDLDWDIRNIEINKSEFENLEANSNLGNINSKNNLENIELNWVKNKKSIITLFIFYPIYSIRKVANINLIKFVNNKNYNKFKNKRSKLNVT